MTKPASQMRFGRGVKASGITLIETMFSIGILAVTATGLYALYSHSMKVVTAGEQASIAQAHTLIRIEQIKNTGWGDVVKPTGIADLLSNPTPVPSLGIPSLANLDGFKQVVSVYPMTVPATVPTPNPTPAATPAAGATPYFTVTRIGAASPVVSPANFDSSTIITQSQLNYRVLTEWRCWGKTHQRELSIAVAKSSSR